MNINPKIFKGYDIRAIYPTDINEENIVQIIKAIYTFLIKGHKNKKVGAKVTTKIPTNLGKYLIT